LKVVVTGANGFIGKHTVRSLLERDYNVEAVDIKTEGLEEFSSNRRCVVHNMDILSEDYACMQSVFEHLIEPSTVLERLKPLLRERLSLSPCLTTNQFFQEYLDSDGAGLVHLTISTIIIKTL